MSHFTLTKTSLFEGVWQGVLESDAQINDQPNIQVTHLEKAISGVQLAKNTEADHWVLRIPIPPEHLSDGVQVFLISDVKSGETLGSFSVLAGEALGDDIRSEITLLREELDMLKRAFRRHCLETM